jgi:hypothetical protein
MVRSGLGLAGPQALKIGWALHPRWERLRDGDEVRGVAKAKEGGDRVVLVTGARSGLGRAMVARLPRGLEGGGHRSRWDGVGKPCRAHSQAAAPVQPGARCQRRACPGKGRSPWRARRSASTAWSTFPQSKRRLPPSQGARRQRRCTAHGPCTASRTDRNGYATLRCAARKGPARPPAQSSCSSTTRARATSPARPLPWTAASTSPASLRWRNAIRGLYLRSAGMPCQ